MKYIGLLLILFIQSISSYTQETNAVNRRLRMYMDVSSGVVNANEDELSLLNDNETEIGLDYSQNFANAPWLRIGFKGIALLNLEIISKTSKVGPLGVRLTAPSTAIYMTFFDIFNVEINTTLQIKPSLGYTVALPVNQYVRFFTQN